MPEVSLIIMLFMFLCALILSKKITGKAISILSLFYFIWLTIIFVSILNIFNFFPIRDFVYYQLLSSASAILLGYFFFYILECVAIPYPKVQRRRFKFTPVSRCNTLSTTAPFLIALIGILTGSYGLYYALVSGINLQELRDTYFFSIDSDFLLSAQRIGPLMWVYQGLMLFYFMKLLYIFVFEQKHRVLFCTYCFSMIIYNLGTGGRTIIMDLLIYFTALLLVLYTLRDKSYAISKIFRSCLVHYGYLFIFFILLVSIVTMYRGDNLTIADLPQKVSTTFITYIVGPFTAFSEFMHTYDTSEVRFGLSFLGFDTVIVSGFMRFLFGLDIPSILSQTSYIMQNGVSISADIVTNAFYTYLFGIYVDGGGIGVFIFSFIAGMLIYYAMKSLQRSLSFYTFTLNITLIYAVFISVRATPIMSPAFVLFLIFVLIDYIKFRKILIRMIIVPALSADYRVF